MGDLKPDYKCEYAKSNKSSCKQCKQKIEKDVVRIGKLERASNFDGEIYVWHHFNCFASKHGANVKDASEIKGLSELKWADQEKIKKQFGSADGGSEEEEDEDEEEDHTSEVFLEYAKSGRSTCKGCYKAIANKELRVGQVDEDPNNGYSSTDFYHLECYQVSSIVSSVSSLRGIKTLTAADKKKVESHFNKAIKGNDKKRKEADDAKEEAAAKRQKTKDTEKAKADKVWKIKEKLKDYNSNELKAILMHNEQDFKAGPAELINRIADGEINGALPICSKCKNGNLVYDAGIIKCVGHQSAWSGCTFTCTLEEVPSRGEWSYPSAKVLTSLVEKVKKEMAKAKEIPSASTTTSTKKNTTLFKDMIAVLVGDIPDKSDVSDLITEHGGQVLNSVVKRVTHLIATYEEVSQEDQVAKVKNAIKWNIPIVSHAFIKTAVKEGSLRSQSDFLLWENGAAKEVDETVPTIKETKKEKKERKKLAVPKIDAKSTVKKGEILVEKGDVYAVMLNMADLTKGQTGLNSFYLMQVIKGARNNFTLFRKWGRVGQEGAHTEHEYDSKKEVMEEFKKIFYEKTRNTFDDFLDDNYEKQPGKFYPIELEADDDEEEKDNEKLKKAKEILAKGTVCNLDHRVQDLVKLLFDTNMFKEQMEQMKIDTKKMPVGKLSKSQIAKGTDVLEEIEEELKKKKPNEDFLIDASNRFYTVIPHDFGLEKPVIINTTELLQKRYELLEILGDIEAAARLLDQEGKMGTHPLTQQYETLKNKIDIVEKDTDEFKRIEKFWNNSKQGRNIKISEVFKVKREGEDKLFKKFKDLDQRKLLWHGSSVAVFAAILSGGLKIMPHAGGRVGSGLYFADMIDKSAQYLGFHGHIGMVLLNEVALGKISRIQHDNSSLKKAPSGYNSVLAEGRIMPNPKDDYLDTTMSESGHPVIIPQGAVYDTKVKGSFQHNEYLVYDQTQVTMRYLIKISSK